MPPLARHMLFMAALVGGCRPASVPVAGHPSDLALASPELQLVNYQEAVTEGGASEVGAPDAGEDAGPTAYDFPLPGPVSCLPLAPVLTLEQAVETALRDNPRLRQADAQVEAARAGADIAFAPFLPETGLAYRYSGFNDPVIPGGTAVPASLNHGVYSFSIVETGLYWTLYDFGRRSGRYGQALTQVSIAELARARTGQAVAYDVVRAYLQVLLAEAVVRVRTQSKEQAEAILRDTEVRRRGGVADREAVLRAEVEVSQAEEELVAARQAVFDAQAALTVALGRPVAHGIGVVDVTARPPFHCGLEQILQHAATARPEVGAARAAVAEALYGVKAAHGEMLPRIYVRGTVIRCDAAGPIEGWLTGAGVHLDQPIFAGGRHKATVRQEKARVAAAHASLQNILDHVSQQVAVAYQAIGTNRERIRLGEISVRQARENLRLTIVKYNNATATPTDVVDAQTALVRAETRYYSAGYDYLESLARLEFAQGGDQQGLLAQLHEEAAGPGRTQPCGEP